mgnify:CR=1 FL=1|tara:strand:- start:12710 stop:15241 length:2532 start_codon:yes stop_codon:yes gene_type:complete
MQNRSSEVRKLVAALKDLETSQKKSAELFPQLMATHLRLAKAHYESKDLESAYLHTKNATQFSGVNFGLLFQAGVLANEMGRLREAGEHWLQSINEDSPELLNDVIGLIVSRGGSESEPKLMEVVAKTMFDWEKLLKPALVKKVKGKFTVEGSGPTWGLNLAKLAFEKDPTAVFYFRALSALAAAKADHLAAAKSLDEYVKRTRDPFFQASARKHRFEKEGFKKENFKDAVDETFPSARAFYNAGVVHGHMLRATVKGSAERDSLEKMTAHFYDLSLARYEKHFTTREGTHEDSDHHIYAMACRNRAMLELGHERWEDARALYTKGLEASPFYELYLERSDCLYKLGRMPEAAQDSDILLTNFQDHLSADLMVIHFYRVISGMLEAEALDHSLEAAEAALEYIESLTPNERKSLSGKIPILQGAMAATFEKGGKSDLAKKLQKETGAKKQTQEDVKTLLTKAADLVRQQKYQESLPVWVEVNQIHPRNIDALNWRLWILATLKNQAPSAVLDEQIQELSKTILNLMVHPSPEWAYAPKNAMVKGFESALGNMAWRILETSSEQNDLLTAVSMIDEATDEVLNVYRHDDLRYLLDIKVRLLLKLKRIDEACLLAQNVLAKDDTFADFQDIKTSKEFKAWQKGTSRTGFYARENYVIYGPAKFQVRPKHLVLLASFAKESVTAFSAYRKAQNLHPTDEEFHLSPEDFSFGREILKAEPELRKHCLFAGISNDTNDLPEFGLLDNLAGEDPIHRYALQELYEKIFENDGKAKSKDDLDFSEEELIRLLHSNQINVPVLNRIGREATKQKSLSPAFVKELKKFAQLAEPDEKKLAEKILKKTNMKSI